LQDYGRRTWPEEVAVPTDLLEEALDSIVSARLVQFAW
jgi:hypothetical protein